MKTQISLTTILLLSMAIIVTYQTNSAEVSANYLQIHSTYSIDKFFHEHLRSIQYTFKNNSQNSIKIATQNSMKPNFIREDIFGNEVDSIPNSEKFVTASIQNTAFLLYNTENSSFFAAFQATGYCKSNHWVITVNGDLSLEYICRTEAEIVPLKNKELPNWVPDDSEPEQIRIKLVIQSENAILPLKYKEDGRDYSQGVAGKAGHTFIEDVSVGNPIILEHKFPETQEYEVLWGFEAGESRCPNNQYVITIMPNLFLVWDCDETVYEPVHFTQERFDAEWATPEFLTSESYRYWINIILTNEPTADVWEIDASGERVRPYVARWDNVNNRSQGTQDNEFLMNKREKAWAKIGYRNEHNVIFMRDEAGVTHAFRPNDTWCGDQKMSFQFSYGVYAVNCYV